MFANAHLQMINPAYGLPGLAFDFADGNDALDARVLLTRAGSATYFDSAGVLQTAGTDVARFDYDPATGAARGLLREGAATNIMQSSEDFSGWTLQNNLTHDSGTVAGPGSNSTADQFSSDGTNGGRAVYPTNITPVAGNTYTFSLFLKDGAGGETDVTSLTFATDWTTANTARTRTALANGWYRNTVTTDISGSGTFFLPICYPCSGDFNGMNVDAIGYTFGAQFELGPVATSYIQTAGSSASRAADVVRITDLSSVNLAEFTAIVEFELSGAETTTARVISFEESGSAYARLAKNGATALRAEVEDSGTQFQSSDFTVAAGSVHTAALAVKANDFAAVLDGGTVSTDVSGTVPTASQISLGYDSAVSGEDFYGWLRGLRIYDSRLADAVLQGRTS